MTKSCITTYQIPGPTVWSGAWTQTTSIALSAPTGPTANTRWSSWIQKSVVTSATFTESSAQVLGTSTYQPAWSSEYQTPAPSMPMKF